VDECFVYMLKLKPITAFSGILIKEYKMKKVQELSLKIEDLEERIAPHALVNPTEVGGNGSHVGHFSSHDELPQGLVVAGDHSPVIASTSA